MKPLDVLLILVSVLFATGLIADHQLAPERREHRESVKLQRKHLDLVAHYLREYKEATGRFPTPEEGLDVIPGLREATFQGEFARYAPILEPVQGVRTPHGVPYVYENRTLAREEAKGAFRNSPQRTDDRKLERFSRRVDDGIFVTSLGLRQDVSRVFGKAWIDALLWFGGGAVLSLMVAYIFVRNRSKTAERFRGVNATIIVGVALVLTLVFTLTGGQSRFASQRRDPQVSAPLGRSDLAREYLGLIREWSAAGAYDPEAYAEVERKMKAEFKLVDPPPAADGAPREN